MLELFFVIDFFLMLLLTGISVLGVLEVGSLAMLFAGLFVTAVKLLPWLLVALAAAWLWRAIKKPSPPRSRFDSRLR
ncbi:Putative exported protein precursor [Candidatus Sodalis pierantonius str. SOPE]|uniref:Putative exported protein n=1 Tax=Candidatus Sodalis pierantonii str. SOPE TaxID=2342 RepID=W0HM71_9GAMM|nr:envelope stress response protein PspG [Candidatus Sodalis pierantonius]AHF73587.1 Putative exported protein precursor [Candidatus Sodalis pierantonius str. SOPE]